MAVMHSLSAGDKHCKGPMVGGSTAARRGAMLEGGEAMGHKQRISYLPLEAMDDEMRAEMERCRLEGTPRPESSAVRAHVPACFWAFARSWEASFRNGVCDHAIKELCRVYVSRSVKCEYCGNQRSEQARAQGLGEGQYDDLLNFETSQRLGTVRRPPWPTRRRSHGGWILTMRSGSVSTSISPNPS